MRLPATQAVYLTADAEPHKESTMQFLATGKFIGEPDTSAHMAEERRIFDELRAEGVIQEVFFMQPGPGVVNVIDAASLEEARTKLARLPYVSLGFVEFDLVEVTRLP